MLVRWLSHPLHCAPLSVVLRRNTAWSQRLWSDLWTVDAFARWRCRKFHEQSSLCRWLKLHEPGFGGPSHDAPWYSYEGGPEVRATEHVWVVPHRSLNTNLGALAFQKHQRPQKVDRMLSEARCAKDAKTGGRDAGGDGGSMSGGVTGVTGAGSCARPEFVFHAVGCAPKVAALREAIATGRGTMSHPRCPDEPSGPASKIISDRRLSMIIPKLVLGAAVDDATFAELAAGYPSEAVGFRFLNLELNRLTSASAAPLARVVRSNPALETIRLGGNELADEGAVALAEALKGNRTLRCLEMGRNKLTVRGLAALLAALQHNRTLVDLDLSGNGLGGSPACRDLVERHLLAMCMQGPSPSPSPSPAHPTVQWAAAATLRDRHASKAGVAGTPMHACPPRVVYI